MADHFIHESKPHFLRGQDWPEKQGVDYKSGSAFIEVEAKNHLVRLADGKNIAYDRLVIAIGSRLYAPVEGAVLPSINNYFSLSAA